MVFSDDTSQHLRSLSKNPAENSKIGSIDFQKVFGHKIHRKFRRSSFQALRKQTRQTGIFAFVRQKTDTFTSRFWSNRPKAQPSSLGFPEKRRKTPRRSNLSNNCEYLACNVVKSLHQFFLPTPIRPSSIPIRRSISQIQVSWGTSPPAYWPKGGK
jgi:hypothetical protein